MYKEIESYDLRRIIRKNNINLIDIRDSYIYSSGTIEMLKIFLVII